MGTEHVHARVLDFSPFALRKKPRARYAGYFCIKYVSFLEKFCEFKKKKKKTAYLSWSGSSKHPQYTIQLCNITFTLNIKRENNPTIIL